MKSMAAVANPTSTSKKVEEAPRGAIHGNICTHCRCSLCVYAGRRCIPFNMGAFSCGITEASIHYAPLLHTDLIATILLGLGCGRANTFGATVVIAALQVVAVLPVSTN